VEQSVVEAVERALEKVRREPRSAQTWGLLGRVLLANGFKNQAAECLEQAERLDGQDPRWPYLRGVSLVHDNPEAGLTLLRRGVALCAEHEPDQTAPALYLAEVLYDRGERGEAESLFQGVEKKEPGNPRLLYNRARQAQERGQLREAAQLLSRLTAYPFSRKKAWFLLAQIYRRLGDGKSAADSARRAGALPEDDFWPDPYQEECQRLTANKQARLARAKAAEQQRGHADGSDYFQGVAGEGKTGRLGELGVAADLIRRGRCAEAEQRLRALLDLADGRVRVRYLLSVALLAQAEQMRDAAAVSAAEEKLRNSVHFAREAIRIQPDHPFAHLHLGRGLVLLGKRREGIAALRIAVSARPDSFLTHLELGKALAAEGQDAEALKELEAAIRCAPPGVKYPAEALQQFRRQRGTRKK
jgi:predicted Zn-dependent protease